MISLALATILMSAGPDPASQNRDGYARCLKDFIQTSLQQKMEPAAFDAAIATACQDKQALFKSAMIASQVAEGMKRPASEKAIGEEIADYLSMAKEDYRAELAAVKTP